MSRESLKNANKRSLAVAAATMALALILLVPAGFGQYSSTLTDTETVAVISDYVNVSQTSYTNDPVFATTESNTGLTGAKYTGDTPPGTTWFSYKVESASGAEDTVVLVTITNRSCAATLAEMHFWITSAYNKTAHRAEVTLLPSSTADDVPEIEVDNDDSASGTIGVATGSGAYQFRIVVNGMTSQDNATMSAWYTKYSINAGTDLNTISGTQYSGKLVVSAVLTADRSVTESGTLLLRAALYDFRDLSDSGWMYIMTMEPEGGGSVQYAWSSDGTTWTYASGSSFSLQEGSGYTASLYLAGIKDEASAFSWREIPNDSGTVFADGTIIFTHDSTWGD